MKINENNNALVEEPKQEDYLGLTNVYDEEIYDVIKQIKEESNISKEYINQTCQDFSKLSESFVEQIISHLKDKVSLYENLFNLKDENSKKTSTFDLKLVTKKTIKYLNQILKIHSQLYESTKQLFQIYLNFLNISKYLNSKNPSDDFFLDKLEDIINSWLFMKLDFEKFDFGEALKNCALEENFKNLILNVCKSKRLYLKLDFAKEKNNNKLLQNYLKMIQENQLNLIGIKIDNLDKYENISKKEFKFSKLKKLYMNNVISESNIKFDQTPKLEKFVMKLCPQIDVSSLNPFPEHLKKIYLEKNNFVDKDFYYIINNVILPNKQLLMNLELLSFAKNYLSKIDLSYINNKYFFNSLTELNFSKNKIYSFTFNKNNYNKLTYINCCYNNLNRSCVGKIPTILGLEGANLFLLNDELFNKYYTSLKEKLTSDKIKFNKISYLNISYIPRIKSIEYFKDFRLNESIILNLKKLDLSYNGLKCDTFFKFIENNKGFFNLRSLNLTGNLFDDTFFEKYLEYEDIFNKLEHLNLNSNNIGDPLVKINYKDEIPINDKILGGNKDLIYKLRLIYKFVEKNKYLTRLNLAENPISKMYSNKNINLDQSSQIQSYIQVDEKNNIIINCFISLFYKIQGEIIQKSDDKYIKRNDLEIIFVRSYKNVEN
jgi:hypothetical protein